MMRKVPLIPTIIVLLAVAIMVALGVWQLGRADEKEALLSSYNAAGSDPALVAFPADASAAEPLLYRSSSLLCTSVIRMEQVAGTSATGRKGWAHRATCQTAAGSRLLDLGWSSEPAPRRWTGGAATGIIAPGPRLVASPPLAGLEPLARPDPGDLPNNHLSYAVQWFLFALTALVIYVLALRGRWRGRQEGRS